MSWTPGTSEHNPFGWHFAEGIRIRVSRLPYSFGVAQVAGMSILLHNRTRFGNF